MRFRILETLREFGQEQLSPAAQTEVQRRHAEYFLRLAEEAETHLRGPEQAQWLDRLEADYDNLEASLGWCGAQAQEKEGAAETGLRLCGALWRYWQVRGPWREGRAHLKSVLAATEFLGSTSARAKALDGAGALARLQNDDALARAYVEESLVIYRRLGDLTNIARSINSLGHLMRDSVAARKLYEEALFLNRTTGNRKGQADNLNSLGLVAVGESDYAAARTLYMEALAIHREMGDKLGVGRSLGCLGMIERYESDYAAARALYEEALAIHREMRDRMLIANSLQCLGYVARYQGDYVAAYALLVESLGMRREIEDTRGIALLLKEFADLSAAQGQAQRAARLFAASESVFMAIGASLPRYDHADRDRYVAVARCALGEASFAAAWSEGSALTLEQVVAYALEGDKEVPAATN
jgi:tetratricopeptide (TPR) repeat protein